MNENKDEDKKEFRGEAIVCFIDILGFSDDIRKNWGKPESDPEHPLNKILAIKQEAKELEKLLENIEDISPEEYITINSISDSFVIRCKLDNSNNYFNVQKIYYVIASAFCTWAACIKNGYTVRGAISIGDVYWDDYSTIGNAFIDVYKLESIVAKNSRIIISSEMNGKLKELFEEKFELGEKQQVYQKFLTKISALLRKDIDGYLILNPKKGMDDFVDKPTIAIMELMRMKDKVTDNIVKEKYTPLIHMMLESENPAPLTASDFGHY